MEVADARTEVLALRPVEGLESARGALAAIVGDLVGPPIEFRFGPLEGEEDDDARDGDTAGPSSGKDEVVL